MRGVKTLVWNRCSLKKTGVEFGTSFIFIPVVYRQKYIYYSFASSEIPWLFSPDFLFHLKQSCPYPFGRKILYISSCFTKWLDDKKLRWLILFFFHETRCFASFPRATSLLSQCICQNGITHNQYSPPCPIILKFRNTQYSAKGRQSVFVHRRKKNLRTLPVHFSGWQCSFASVSANPASCAVVTMG